MRKECIYILGDAKAALRVKMRFLAEGFDAYSFAEPDEMLAQMAARDPDLVFSLGHSPDNNAGELCVKVREKSAAIIIISGQAISDMDRIAALSVGADLYVRAPFSPSVLIAQIHAFFRRTKLLTHKNGQEKKDSGYLVDTPEIKIDTKSRTVIVDNKPITLTAREFDILALLAAYPGQVFYTSQIFQTLWDADSILSGDDRTVAVHISNLRKKIEIDPFNPRFIITLRGVGYKFQPIAQNIP